MPVSHLSLNVGHIPSATSFFLSTLQPLGYRYVGQRGDSIALGVGEADFFLTQQSRRISPTHIAFTANDRLAVRNCYTAALNAGGRPSGTPAYCNNEGTVFNAAVEDLDGNTIEFIYRESLDPLAREDGVPSPASHELLPQTAETMEVPAIRRSVTAPASQSSEFPTRTIVGTILGVAAGAAVVYAMTASERKNARDEDSFKAATERTKSMDAIELRSVKSERSAKPDRRASATDAGEDRQSSTTSRHSRSIKLLDYDRPPSDIPECLQNSQQKSYQRSNTVDAIEYVSASEPQHARQHTTRSPTMIEDHQNHYIEAPPARSSVSSRQSARRDSVISSRSNRTRHSHHASEHSDRQSSANTIKASEHRSRDESPSAAGIPLPASVISARSHRSRHSHHDPELSDKQSSANTIKASEHRSRDESPSAAGIALPASVISSRSHRSRHSHRDHENSDRQSSAHTIKRSEHRSRDESPSAAGIELPASVISSRSHRSRHSHRDSRHSDRQSSANTIKASEHRSRDRSPSAAGIALPASIISSRSHRSRHSHHSHHGSRHSDRRSSTNTIKSSQHRYRDESSAAGIPLPASVATHARSHISAARVPIPESREGEWSDAPEDDSDGLDDAKTVGPEDSISCVDFSTRPSAHKSGTHHSRSMHLESLRSESQSERIARMGNFTSPARSKYSDMTLPVRAKKRTSDKDREYRRGAMSYT
ncbi:Hypothetical protein R9X50_00048100 [Acrodontium crateriforme]|uniref:VOC domain-containing protein n=1 Tax=Acrodontium crateriforme TaxID=150365 RepID=A0AAQ3M0Q8_9PEZI|nr:Hypothetical protein R9X50_00048100 [Acrodontium crateriforme]